MRGYLGIPFIFVPQEEQMNCSRSTWANSWPSRLMLCHALRWKGNQSAYAVSLRRLRGHLQHVCQWHLGTVGVKGILKFHAEDIGKPGLVFDRKKKTVQGWVFSPLWFIRPGPHGKHSPFLTRLTPTRSSCMGKNRDKAHSSHIWILYKVDCGTLYAEQLTYLDSKKPPCSSLKALNQPCPTEPSAMMEVMLCATIMVSTWDVSIEHLEWGWCDNK